MAAIGFGADQIRTLVFMATYSSHKVIMGKAALSRFSTGFDRTLFILAGRDAIHKSLDEVKIGWIRSQTTEVAALERMKKSHKLIMD